MSCGSIFRQAMGAAEMLKADFGITADLWVATSLNELAREAQDVARAEPHEPDRRAEGCPTSPRRSARRRGR